MKIFLLFKQLNMIRIKTKEIGNNGHQAINGYVDDYHVISLKDGILKGGKGVWTVSMSSCLVSDIDKARKMHECVGRAFAKYDEIVKIKP